MKKATTVLRYPGGKSRAVKAIITLLPQVDTYISPFFGGGSIELSLAINGKRIIANDKFEPLYNFWVCLKEDASRVITEVRKHHPLSKEEFYSIRTLVLEKERDSYERAGMYFSINRSSFSGATLSGGYSAASAVGRFNESSIERLAKVDLSNIEFHNLDFSDFITQYGDMGYMYLDPPYLLKSSKLYGNSGDLHETFNHEQLATLLLQRSNWLLSYNNCEQIRQLYITKSIREVFWAYGMSKDKTSKEIIISDC